MTQQDVAAAVGRLEGARQAATDHGMKNVIMSTADCDAILSVLQQRSGDERERVARIIDPAAFLFSEDELPKGDRSQFEAYRKADAIIGGQSCP